MEMCITGVLDAGYDAATNKVSAQCETPNGVASLEIDGVSFAALMGLANLDNAIAERVRLNQAMPWLRVTAINAGEVTSKSGDVGYGLSLMIPEIGLLNFFLTAEGELFLREKLQTPRQSS